VTHDPSGSRALHICADSLAFQGRIIEPMPAATLGCDEPGITRYLMTKGLMLGASN
jgi:hypothetical protein